MDSLIKAIATALDTVERELLGASTNHGKRIAVLCAKMGEALGKGPDEIMSLTNCALLHDNALTEYILSERNNTDLDLESGSKDINTIPNPSVGKHCKYGQRNVDTLRFNTCVKEFILYHHERADGKGPFGIRAGEGPIEAELIAIADSIDVSFHLQRVKPDSLSSIRNYVSKEIGKKYSKTAAEAMLGILDQPLLLSLGDNEIMETTEALLLPWNVEVEAEALMDLASFVIRIIDYKSAFTRRHSSQIANKAWFMGGYYRYKKAERVKLYLAAAFHDIGKLEIPAAILEKPAKLNDEEFAVIKNHVFRTWELLKDIDGFESVCAWASNHHETLPGTGYPFGKKADELDFNSRLMACLDIYQAVSEERPYHPARDHESTMRVLYEMSEKGKIDGDIVKDLSIALAQFDGGDLPQPEYSA